MTTPHPDAGPPSPADEPLDTSRLEALRPGLELLALRALGDRELAREAAQETLARAAVASTREVRVAVGRLAAFVAGIARHVVIDLRRARARAHLVDIDAVPLPTGGPDPLEALIDRGEAAAVRRTLGRLPPADQELLRLCFYEGMTPAEIATLLGEPADRVRKRKSRALERLRELFRGASGHDPGDPPTTEVEDQ